MPAPAPSSADLIALCLEDGSASIWSEFVARFQPLIASVILRTARRSNVSNSGLVDDLVQETFLRLCKDDCKILREFEHRHEGAIFGYLKVVAASVAMDYFRNLSAQKRAADRLAEPEEMIDRYRSTSATAEQELMLQEIDRCVERVSDGERDRTIFWLYYQRGFTAADIAKLPKIGLSAKGVESCLHRLTKAVRMEVANRHSAGTSWNKGKWPPSTLGEQR